MPRFASIVLTNPARPEFPAIPVKALVTQEPFALTLGEEFATRPQLKQVALRSVEEVEGSPRLMPYMGPLRVTLGTREAFIGAVICGSGVVIGQRLLAELGMAEEKMVLSRAAPAKDAEEVEPPEPLAIPASEERILVVEQAVSAEQCRKILEYAATQPRHRLGVTNTEYSTLEVVHARTEISQRDTFRIDTKRVEGDLNRILYTLFVQRIEPFFGETIEWWENPQLLYYTPGGKYDTHADADRWVQRPGGEGAWERFHDRDISVILYLNEAFTGGALHFPDQRKTIQPKAGMLVAFPSSADYRHAAQPTESGERFALVTWAAVRGSPRVREKPKYVVWMDNATLNK